jgi:hypothetical protein
MNKQQTIVNKMDNLYHTYIDIQSKKSKISINLPQIVNDTNYPEPMLSEIEPINLTIESETEVKYSDEYIYKKPWNKLNSIHKIIKVKEFVNNLHSDDIEMKKNLKIILVNMIKERKITKKTDINYDMVNGNIISIPILQYVNNKYIV